MKLLSIQVGLPREVPWQRKPVSTGIFKSKIEGPVWVRKFNLEGDGQADLTVHGGRDKAVYAYSKDAYLWWRERLKVSRLGNGSFGENLTFSALDEEDLCIGDILALGKCELQITQPRFPCFKLGIKFQDMGILKTFLESGRPGIYFRVLKEGKIDTGDSLKVLSRDPEGVSVSDFFQVKVEKYQDKKMLKRLLAIKTLNGEWREKFSEALKKREDGR